MVQQPALEDLFSAVHDGVALIDDSDQIVFINRSLERMLGCSAEEAVGQEVGFFCPDEYREDYLREIGAFRRSAARVRAVNEHSDLFAKRMDGTVFPVEVTLGWASTLGDGLLILTIRDVTRQKERERALQEAHASVSALFRASPVPTYALDGRGRVLSWNPAAEETFGWTADEVVGRVLPTVPDELRDEFRALVRRAMAGESFNGVEVKRRRKDGRMLDISLHSASLRDPDSSVVGKVVLAVDITERKEWESRLEMLDRHLEELNETLELKVKERTAAAEARARELARANAELEQFAYVASHDLQEPLRMITSYTKLLARRYKGKLDRDADEFIEFAVDGATRMQKLINDLLTYSRAGQGGVELKPVDCEVVFSQAVANLRTMIHEAGAEVTCGPLPRVKGDASQLVRLLQNLIANGIKFRSDRPPRIRVSAEKKRGTWVFSVSDNGIGIDPRHRERIFEIFQKLHPRAEYPGTGIGLAICKKIVDRHGGRIWVESKPGLGSTFRFTIPLDKESYIDDRQPQRDPSARQQAG